MSDVWGALRFSKPAGMLVRNSGSVLSAASAQVIVHSTATIANPVTARLSRALLAEPRARCRGVVGSLRPIW
jgi:hypothetical protein